MQPKVLMILTSHRLDCFRLCMDMLIQGGSIRRFDTVALLLNGVVGRHRRYVDRLLREHPEVPWDVISGPRGKGWCISNLQNECVKRHPDALYFKIDEDVFVSADWDVKLAETHGLHCTDPDLALVSATIPNNGFGAWILLGTFPELREEFLRLPHARWEMSAAGCVWFYPHLATWMIRHFLSLADANERMRRAAAERWVPFHSSESSNGIILAKSETEVKTDIETKVEPDKKQGNRFGNQAESARFLSWFLYRFAEEFHRVSR